MSLTQLSPQTPSLVVWELKAMLLPSPGCWEGSRSIAGVCAPRQPVCLPERSPHGLPALFLRLLLPEPTETVLSIGTLPIYSKQVIQGAAFLSLASLIQHHDPGSPPVCKTSPWLCLFVCVCVFLNRASYRLASSSLFKWRYAWTSAHSASLSTALRSQACTSIAGLWGAEGRQNSGLPSHQASALPTEQHLQSKPMTL